MKKILNYLWIALAIFVLAACSGASSYSSEKCKALEEKVKNHEELTDADYSEMIDQVQAIVDILKEKEKECGDDAAKKKEFAASPEAREYAEYMIGFGLYLDTHADKLSDSNKKKLNKLMSEYEKEKDL